MVFQLVRSGARRMVQPIIESLYPLAGIEGGEVIIHCRDCNFSSFNQVHIQFDIVETRPIGASQSRVIVPIPSSKLLESGVVKVHLQSNNLASNGVDFIVGQKLAENLHPVGNPAYDRDNGAIYTTL